MAVMGIGHYPAGDVRLLASRVAGDDLKGWYTWREPVSHSSAPGFAETATWRAFTSAWTLLISWPARHTFMHPCAHTYPHTLLTCGAILLTQP